ncbi:MAG: hypothetical protein L0I24_00435 [Pseudonocardia sp.]|nr:hypothetical protein [Pseudonocardia sp.]
MRVTPRLCGLAYELGEYAEPVAELPELLADAGAAAALTAPASGFRTYHWSDVAVTELMMPAARRTLLAAELSPSDVDLVVLATDSLPRTRAAHAVVAELLQELGLSAATAVTLGLMDCATAMMAVGTAASYVRDGTARQVLVLSGDVADEATGGQRIVAGGAAIASDAAASVLVSCDRPGLPVLAMAQQMSPQLHASLAPQRQLFARIEAHQVLFNRLQARCGVSLAAITRVLPSNFARNVQRMYLSEVGFTDEQLELSNVGRIAHCLGSDPLISLADQLTGGADGPDGPTVLLGSGITHLAAVLTTSRSH